MPRITYSNFLPFQRYARLQRELQALVDYAALHPYSHPELRNVFRADTRAVMEFLDPPPVIPSRTDASKLWMGNAQRVMLNGTTNWMQFEASGLYVERGLYRMIVTDADNPSEVYSNTFIGEGDVFMVQPRLSGAPASVRYRLANIDELDPYHWDVIVPYKNGMPDMPVTDTL